MSQCDPFTLLNASSCFSNLTGPQLQIVIASLLCQILQAANPVATCDPLAILKENGCWSALTPFQLSVVQTQLLCEILQTGGGGGANACLVAQSGGPVAACGNAFGIGYDNDSASPTAGQFWFWSSSDNAWVKFIS